MYKPFLNNTKRDYYTFKGSFTGEEIKNTSFSDGDIICVNIPDVEKKINGEIVTDDEGNPIKEPGTLELDGLSLKNGDTLIYYNGWTLVENNKITVWTRLERIGEKIISSVKFRRVMHSLNSEYKDEISTWRNIQKEFNEIMDDLCSEISKRK